MKKVLFMAALAFSTCFIACSKDGNKKENTETNSLSGTSWVFADEWIGENNEVFTSKETLTFTSETTIKRTYVVFDKSNTQTENFKESGTYTYKHPAVTMTYTGDSGKPVIVEGIIDGNKMTITGEDYQNIYIKQ